MTTILQTATFHFVSDKTGRILIGEQTQNNKVSKMLPFTEIKIESNDYNKLIHDYVPMLFLNPNTLSPPRVVGMLQTYNEENDTLEQSLLFVINIENETMLSISPNAHLTNWEWINNTDIDSTALSDADKISCGFIINGTSINKPNYTLFSIQGIATALENKDNKSTY